MLKNKFLKGSYYFIAFAIFSNMIANENDLKIRLLLSVMIVASLSYFFNLLRNKD
ncbi:hypothetical protein [Peptoniphilus indolicus]|uniref:Uncharacterized protein n=1 Tax=Peptoniphilus indolicus ATCC 29427 TaxID=997350 RepID=G4D1L7_9FIRM|nr:hypothetical protein [Peptoniphilus indolicus]EGY80579.1 hypothetical protein HMPREF9129_0297 [Peptoniphilus indolicus ATCC 29427]